ncbi:MAG TPA: hypothetical protein VFG65_01310 [Fimbriimonadales bacterium]|nr:hypothetical protein [Fimbriimonadales bacterium]
MPLLLDGQGPVEAKHHLVECVACRAILGKLRLLRRLHPVSARPIPTTVRPRA